MPVHLRDLTLRQLRALAAVAEGGSVTAAAHRLHLTQPAVTLQLRNLQELAGLPLLQRSTSGMTLTDAGAELLTLHRRIEAAIAGGSDALDLIAGCGAGRVSIGAVSTAKYFVPFAIGAFSKRHPHVDVTLHIGNRVEIHQALRELELDIVIMGRPPEDFPVEQYLLGDHPHVIVAARGHALARARGLRINDLQHETFLLREPGSGTRNLMEKLCARYEFTPRTGMAINSNETIKQAVIAELGIAFISAHTVASEIEDGRLVMLDVEGLPLLRQWWLVRPAEKVLLPPSKALLDFLREDGRRFLPGTRPAFALPAPVPDLPPPHTGALMPE